MTARMSDAEFRMLHGNDPWWAAEHFAPKGSFNWRNYLNPDVVYFIRATNDSPVKIGYTSGPVERRLQSLQSGSHERLQIFTLCPGDRSHEHALHKAFANYRLEGEWFDGAAFGLKELMLTYVTLHHVAREKMRDAGLIESVVLTNWVSC